MSVNLSGPAASPAAASPPAAGASSGVGGGAGATSYSGGGGGGGFGAQVANAALNDPTMQGHLKDAAYSQASQGLNVAKEGAAAALSELRKYVQEGPAGLSILCFLGGIVTTIVGAFGLLNVWATITSPFGYVLNIYLTLFGMVTFLLEADMESFKRLKVLGKLAPFVEQYQLDVFNRAKILTELKGRGFYYIFVGTLAATQCFFCLFFLVGVWNLLMGVLCLMMSYGINPADHMNVNAQGGSNAPLVDGRGMP